MTKIGVISDLHLGYRQYGLKEREEDFYIQFNKCIDKIIHLQCDLCIMAGDIFDTAKPSPKAISVFENGLSKLNDNNIPVVNIVGNHTQLRIKDHFEADKLFTTNYDYYLLDGDEPYTGIRNLSVFGLPYHSISELDQLKDKIKELNDKTDNDGYNILVLHQEFKEYSGFTGVELSINDIEALNFDIIICGHIHSREIDIDDETFTFLQPGSIERLNVAEAKDEIENGKGVSLIEIPEDDDDIGYFFYPIKSDREFIIKEVMTTSIDEIHSFFDNLEDICKQCEDAIVSYKVNDTTGQLSLIRDYDVGLSDHCLSSFLRYTDLRVVPEEISGNDIGSKLSIGIALSNALDEKYGKEYTVLAKDLLEKLGKNDPDIEGSAALCDDFYHKHYENIE